MKVLITGGHPAPALAVIDYARENEKYSNLEFVFVGRQYNNSRENSLSFEYQEVKKRNIPFFYLETGRLTRMVSLGTIRNILMIPMGFYRAFQFLQETKPDRILTFGGYIALPVAVMGWIVGIPVFLHEQTIHPGLATKLIAKVAKTVFISFPDAKKYLPAAKTVLTGNTVRKSVFEIRTVPFDIPSDKPVIYITGGSLGSHSVNVHIEKKLQELLTNYTLIHQTGNVQEYNDFHRLSEMREALPLELKQRYFVREHFDADEIGYIYSKADLVIGRSGANTIFELIALQKPSILVPLPWSAHDEQLLQAKMMEKTGVAAVFDQNQDSATLLSLIQQMLNSRDTLKEKFSNLAHLYNPHAEDMVLEAVLKN